MNTHLVDLTAKTYRFAEGKQIFRDGAASDASRSEDENCLLGSSHRDRLDSWSGQVCF